MRAEMVAKYSAVRTDVVVVVMMGVAGSGKTTVFMKPAMLDSQFATLEAPVDAITLDVAQPVEAIVSQILAAPGDPVPSPRGAGIGLGLANPLG